ncbi:MAG: DUF4142 domain-containing protein [Opitutaceae bacterium]|nr:DUF4142 domain-containing protein [Opitutaceae bacterium]
MKTHLFLSTTQRRSLGVLLALSVASFASAQTHTQNTDPSTRQGSEVSRSTNSGDTVRSGTTDDMNRSGAHGTGNAAGSDYTGNTAGNASRELSGGDRRAVMKAHKLNEKEVALSRIAQERATNPEIKAFAAEMVREHQNVGNELQQFVQRRNIQFDQDDRADVRAEEKKWLDKRGDDFDKDYVKAMIDAHEDTIDVLERAAESKDSELAAWGNKTLPSVRMHLKRAEALRKQIRD